MSHVDIDSLLDNINSNNLFIPFGRIVNISSSSIVASGLEVAIGDIVRIESEETRLRVLGMVVSVEKSQFTVVPF